MSFLFYLWCFFDYLSYFYLLSLFFIRFNLPKSIKSLFLAFFLWFLSYLGKQTVKFVRLII